MRKRIINLRFAGRCADCGAVLEVGAPARYYGRGKVYGTECHEDGRKGGGPRREVEEADGGGHCEDFPCCGHGDGMCASERRAEKRAQARKAERVTPTPQIEAPAPYTGGLLPDVETAADFQTELLDPFGADR